MWEKYQQNRTLEIRHVHLFVDVSVSGKSVEMKNESEGQLMVQSLPSAEFETSES